ncbi:unnamed protein product [marine sediment metagenome]|uniref:Uncharacterized protein n=1 Tax=marine sediment metagenome TaxID=412755 RepID=X1QE82_9ZZZZ
MVERFVVEIDKRFMADSARMRIQKQKLDFVGGEIIDLTAEL